MDGAADRDRLERARMWNEALLHRAAKLPDFNQFVDPPKRHERQSPVVQQAMFEALAVAWGAERVH